MYSFLDLERVCYSRLLFQSVILELLCPILTVAFWPAYKFTRRQVRWSGIPLLEFSTVCCDPHKVFGIINKAEIDVFLELSWFFDDPSNDVGKLISGSSAFPKSSLNIWNFTVHVLLKPGLENFWALLYYCVRWVQLCSSLSILWHCLSLGLEWKLTFSHPVATAEFSKFAGILSAALSQHHLSGFEIAQLEFYHLH